jgi:hypothetical protein
MARWERAEKELVKATAFVRQQGRRLRDLYRYELNRHAEQERICRDIVAARNKEIANLRAALADAQAARPENTVGDPKSSEET